jgi:hypothetical protein
MSTSQHKYDVFISHASEDKIECAKLLADELMSYGAVIWYDEFSLEIGDSLSKSITEGLAKSNYGIVVLSRDFINKGWTNFELEGLINREIGNRKIILPVWHNITHAELMEFSPVVAGRVALDTAKHSVEEIAFRILKVVRPDIYDNLLRKVKHQELLASAKTQKMSSAEAKEKIKFGPVRHKTLSNTLLRRIQIINSIFSEVLNGNLEKTINDFQRDSNPENEIQVWERMSTAYLEFVQESGLTLSQKKEAVSFLLSASFGEEAEKDFEPNQLSNEQIKKLSFIFRNAPLIPENNPDWDTNV